MNGGKANLNGANVEKGSGYGRQNSRQANSPQNRQLQADTAGGLSARHRPHETQPAAGRPCSKNKQLPQMMSACRAGKWGECSGTGSHEGGCRPTYTCPYPTYRLCLSLSLPTPLICKPQFSPKLNFFFFFFYPLLPHYNSSPNPL